MLANKILFWYSRKIPMGLRNFMAKMYLKYIRLQNIIKYRNKDMFHYVSIELTRTCNRRCVYCPISLHPSFGENSQMSFELYSKIIKELKKMKYRGTISFTGFYEPLMFKKFMKYLRYLRRELPKTKIILYTNGDYLTEEVFSELEDMNVFSIVSLHEDKDNNNFIRLSNFTNEKYALLKKNIQSGILSTRGNIVNVKKKERKTICIIPAIELTIDSNGNVIFCSDDFFSVNKYGNVAKSKLLDIWNNQEYKKLRKEISNGKFKLEICKGCI